MCLISSHEVSSYLFIEIKSLLKKIPSTPLTDIKFLINSLRLMILELNNVLSTQLNRTDKSSLIFNYVTGHEFKSEMESIVDTFMRLQDDLESEKRSQNAHWSKRERQLSILVKNTSSIYGTLKGLAGTSIKTIDKLDLPKIESDH